MQYQVYDILLRDIITPSAKWASGNYSSIEEAQRSTCRMQDRSLRLYSCPVESKFRTLFNHGKKQLVEIDYDTKVLKLSPFPYEVSKAATKRYIEGFDSSVINKCIYSTRYNWKVPSGAEIDGKYIPLILQYEENGVKCISIFYSYARKVDGKPISGYIVSQFTNKEDTSKFKLEYQYSVTEKHF